MSGGSTESAGFPGSKPVIAVFSGPTATIGNSPPLVTSNQARARHGLPLHPGRFDVLRAQRLAAPVTVYIEAHSAHPLEADAAELYAPPDGWLSADGTFTPAGPGADPGAGTPVYLATLAPEDGLYLLPYMARQADGSAWEDAVAFPFAPPEQARQTFYPDASRIYEEIDRFGIGGSGLVNTLSNEAEFRFFRAAPSGGYKQGLPAERRTDEGEGDIPPETLGEDFWIYYPYHIRAEPHLITLARATNLVQRTLASGAFTGAQWLEGSPTTEETMYWLNLVIDTTVPLVGHSAQRPHQSTSADGDRNLVDGVKYLLSGIWRDATGADQVGAVMIVDEVVFSAREVTKTDARPGNYEATGGHGGIVADMGGYGPPQLTYLPTKLHTHRSEVNLTKLPDEVPGVTGSLAPGGVVGTRVRVKDLAGELLASAMPRVSIAKYGRYMPADSRTDPELDPEVMARLAANLAEAPLAGFVGEGANPYGLMNQTTDNALGVATFCGYPVVKVGRGNTAGMAYHMEPHFIVGNNLTSTKARMLLMAALLKLGALPVATDPFHPTGAERAATLAAVAAYQAIFDTH